jgi:aryl-alcohol dehydrogenase-like predicted oxidoreductase
MQVALAWLLRRSPNILLIPGTSSVAHLRENLAAVECVLADDAIKELDSMASIGSVRLTNVIPRGARADNRAPRI